MTSMIAPLISPAITVGFLIVMTHHYWAQLFEHGASSQKSFFSWAAKGIVGPVLTWVALNSGVLPPLLPEAEFARNQGKLLPLLFNLTASALWIVGSFWAAATFIWMLSLISAKTTDRRELLVLVGFTLLLLSPLVWLIASTAGIYSIGFALLVWLVPIIHLALPWAESRKLPPMYSRALAKIKFGKYKEAEVEVIHELEKCEADYEGWLMLSELYAKHFHELNEAERTILDLAAQPNLTPVQVSIAFERLAEWHLKIGEDPEAARRALQQICDRFPGTLLAREARQKLRQMPATREEWLQQRQPKRIRLPPLRENLDEPSGPRHFDDQSSDAAQQANRWVEKLRLDPNNVEAREELAVLFAENLQQAHLGIEQLELLIGMPDQPEQKMAHWLSLIAAWQIRLQANPQAARRTLQRIIRDYPRYPQAFAAQRRLYLLEMDEKSPAKLPK